MKTNDDEFFREAVSRICGSGNIEKALQECFFFLKNYIPMNQVILNIFDNTTNMAEAVVRVSDDGILLDSIIIPYTRQVKKDMEAYTRRSKRVWMVRRLGDYEGTRHIAEKSGTADFPGVIMDLDLDGRIIGKLTIIHSKETRFSQEHLRLLEILNTPFAFALSHHLKQREIRRLKDIVEDNQMYYQEELNQISGGFVIGADSGLKPVMEMVRRVAHQDSPVLLIGETGVGKEVIAKALHRISPRSDKPFIGVNCGAIPESLMDSELFGHEKGAFTGAAVRKRGRFERADGGSIFLDEVGELKKEAQVRLLRVLQEKEIERVGGTETLSMDIRVIAATHRNLEEMIRDKIFREDLYFRLKVFPIYIPPLRERILDIPALVSHFIQKKSVDMKLGIPPSIAPGQIDKLMEYHWPGNVRELENAVERALILYNGQQLHFDGLEASASAPPASPQEAPAPASLNLDEAMARHITQALKSAQGKIHGPGGAAELLGINPMTLRHRLKKLGIPFGRAARENYSPPKP
ncbi:Transcriptional regulator containing GAF, AAA-type ATPase, and DNA-binding Fis domains [Desulfatibacillum alkenivorans DSM 16219]|jgi:transcriptional regulator with GAF, ATPase, and Fis domain|uniref:Transcriptional regulator containing GAF, AAA-type ATPase, and DNA-binding Fis domains n=1 Tax=Desulfatibacillum alkenivorans DSM 16219 TaxID=1121393 RepID=A0A1M6TDS9_9BACT|nr:sigma 54-interacting transcriptional regulator [Desulfatibacillum alkenivorans]SHK55130.1 Transcriptional regulator containing GAF, AAA-type ATPase, and DNA-binding Fis domains [Desulfatibacillum alkenivorans DSM 16219]